MTALHGDRVGSSSSTLQHGLHTYSAWLCTSGKGWISSTTQVTTALLQFFSPILWSSPAIFCVICSLAQVYKLTSRLWRKYDDLVLDFLRDCNNGQDLPDIGIIPKKNSRRSAQHAKKALKRRRQDSSSACTSSSSSSDPDDSACDGQNNNSSADSDEDEDDASEQESEEELDENATGESSEEKEDEEDDDDGPRRRRSAARSHRKPAAAAATAAATPARNCRAPAKPVKATPRTPAKPPLKLKIKVTQQQQPQQAPPAKRQRRAAQRATYFDDSSDGEENFTPASAAVSSADSVPSNEVTGTSRSGRTIKRNSRFRQM